MSGTIDALNPTLLHAAPLPAKAQAAPGEFPDLRDTQAGVKPAKSAGQSDLGQTPGPEKQLEQVLNERLARLLGSNVRLRIEIDQGTGDFVYKSIDKQTGEVDRQWPTEKILRMLAFFRELDGLLFDKTA